MSKNLTVSASNKDRLFQIGAWSLAVIVSIIGYLAWGGDYGYTFSKISGYQLFPLLGILAFSIMWSHYVSGTIGEIIGASSSALKRYYQYTGYVVLALICLHPGILIYSLFRDGKGLPPSSYEHYVAPGLGWITLLGTVSFTIFIAYEFKRVFADKPWWHFVTEAGDFAMLAILYHGLRLGGQLVKPGTWFRDIWWTYFVILTAILIRSYYIKYGPRKTLQQA